MKYFPDLGIAAPELGWVPSPTFVLRRAAILERIDQWTPGRVLEVGCGSGAVLYEFARRGFSGTGVESSEKARTLAEQMVTDPKVEIMPDLPDKIEVFDYLVSFEVLEHIEDDAVALREWTQRLKPGGRCLISVPAHRNHWNVTDVMAGHFRRYDRDDILKLVSGAGLRVKRIETYGWPATWFIERARHLVRVAQIRAKGIDVDDIQPGDPMLTGESGVERGVENRLFSLYGGAFGRPLMRLAARAQRPFAAKDWGISYLVTSERP